MRIRVISLFLFILASTSCDFFSFQKKSGMQEVDTIIDFSTVDVAPSFDDCKSYVEKEKKSNCFRNTIYKHISTSLAKHNFEVRNPIEEVINVSVTIDSRGNATVHQIVSSALIKKTLPNLDSLVKRSVASLPKMFPAIKRGIPVTTQYQIPIQISVK